MTAVIAPRITVMVAAHNEERDVEATLRSALDQTTRPDRVLVAADNCTDSTVAVARSIPGVDVFETVANRHRKAGALNQAWEIARSSTDLFVCIDADTILPPTAVADWVQDFLDNPGTGGVSAKFTMLLPDQLRRLAQSGEVPHAPTDRPPMTWKERTLVRLQRAEFAKWTDTALRRREQHTSVLAGTACAVSARALEDVAASREGEHLPWTYQSEVEDFELTYRLRSLGYPCRVSTRARAYTGAMLSVRTLWAQRMKWQVGTAVDLRQLGWNRLTRFDWYQQALGLGTALLRIMWVGLLVADVAVFHHVRLMRHWWIFPLLFVLIDTRAALRIPHRTRSDVLTAALFLPAECFAWLRAAWFLTSWVQVLRGNIKDRWLLQILAEGGELCTETPLPSPL
jgi:cellulose synthase/poly-beta-1,6-N-acetylglucosamine synthase-like glycosyltransferase